MDSTPGSGRSPGGWHGNPLQYSCLKKSHGQREEPGKLQSMGSQRVRHNLSDLTHTRIKVLEDSTGENHYLVFGKEFLDMTPKA